MANSTTVGALRVVLSADASEFQAAMKQASAETQALAQKLISTLEPQQRAVNAAVRDFLGTDTIRKAQEYAKAIENIGGVAALTEEDQKRVNKVVSEALDHYKALGQTAPKALQDLAAATSAAEKPTESYATSFGRLVASYVSGQAIWAAVTSGFHAVTGQIEASIQAAGDAEKAHTQLVAALRAQGTAVPSVVEAYTNYASALQKTTIYQDDAIEGAEALLVQIGNVMPRDMDKALKAATNLASGLGIDLDTAVRTVAKAAEGNVTALQKMGVTIDASKAKQHDFGTVLDAITAKFGGQAEAIAGTYQGRLAQLANSWNNVQESIGRVLTQNATLLAAFGLLNQQIDSNTHELNQNRQVSLLVSDAVILTVRGFAELATVLNVAQGVAKGWTILVRNLGADLGYVGIAALEAAKGVAVLSGNAASAQLAEAGIKSLRESIDELGRRNDQTEQSFLASRDTLQGFSARADDLAKQLAITRGQVVTLTDATDTGTDAWDRHTKAVTSVAEAEKQAAEAEKVRLFWIKQADEAARNSGALLLELRDKMQQEANARAKVIGEAFLKQQTDDLKASQEEFQGWVDMRLKAMKDEDAEMDKLHAKAKAENDAFVNGVTSALTPIFAAISNAGSTSMRAMSGAIQGAIGLWQQYATSARTAAAASAAAWGAATLGVSALVSAIVSIHQHNKQAVADVNELGAQIKTLGGTVDDAALRAYALTGNIDKLRATLQSQLKDLQDHADIQATIHVNVDAATTGLSKALGITSDAMAKVKADQDNIAGLQAKLTDTQVVDLAKIADLKAKIAGADAVHAASYEQQISDILRKEGDLALDSSLVSQIDEANADLQIQQKIIDATMIASQAGADAVAGSIQAIIDHNVKAGMSYADAVRAAQPLIAGLQKQLDKTGMVGGEAFAFINQELGLVTGAVSGPALDALQGYTAGVTGLANAGLLTQDRFAGLEGQIGSTYTALTAQGTDGNALLVAMQGELQTAWELEQKFGYKADEATQALIDEAAAAGIVGEDHKSATDQMIDGIKAVVAAIKDLTDSLTGHGGVTDAAATAAQGIKDHFAGLRITVPVDFSVNGTPGPGPVNLPPGGYIDYDGTPRDGNGNELPHAAKGMVVQPSAGGTAIVTGEAGYPETVLPGDWSRLADFAADYMAHPSYSMSTPLAMTSGGGLSVPASAMGGGASAPTSVTIEAHYHGPDAEGWRRVARNKDFQRELVAAVADNVEGFAGKLRTSLSA